MIRLFAFTLLITANMVLADDYGVAADYGKSLLGGLQGDLGKVSPDSVPGFEGINNKGLDNGDVLDRQTPLAAQGKYGSFVSKQFNRENKIILSGKDESIVAANKLTDNPVNSVAGFFNGKAVEVKSNASRLKSCEESGNPYLISCKYLLKPVPYYGERVCEEQHEKSVESCVKTLEVVAQYETKICQQQGNSIIKTVVATLQEKAHEKKKMPIIEKVYKGSVNYVQNRHTPYHWRRKGKAFHTNDAWAGKWSWKDRVIGDEMRHPDVKIIAALYRETPVFDNVMVLDKKRGGRGHNMVHERRLVRWDRTLTKMREAQIPDSVFHWVGDTYNISGAKCVKTDIRCLDAKDRELYGVTVKKSCWKKEITYQCDFPSKNDCKDFRSKGCSQIDGKCLRYHEGVCVNYQNTMRCFKRFQDKWSGCESFKNRDSCKLIRDNCEIGKSSKFLAGQDVARDCWKRKLSHECSYPALNNCEQLRLPSCKQIKQVCKKMVGKTCTVMSRTYKCVDGVNDGWETNCHDLEKKALQGFCERITHKAEDESTKLVDGFEHSSVWSKTNIFKCQYPSKNNCSILKARGCLEKSKQCLRSVSDTCVVWGKTFECSLHVQTSQSIKGKLPKCLDGSCRGDEDINDGNIGEAVAQLSVLQEISKDIKGDSPTNPSIFKGDSRYCKTNPLGFKNCCRLNGWGNTIGLAKCTSSEKQLAHLRSKKYCVPIGKYCAKWAPAKAWCIQKKRSYCCFKGKLQRILQVEARRQLGIGWGSADNPNCQGLSAESLQKVDFSKINLTEVYGDVLAGYKNHDVAEIQQSLKSQLTGVVQKGGYQKEPPTGGNDGRV